MPGALIPEWFINQLPGRVEMNVASIIWGVSIAAGMFTASKGAKQALNVYKRKGHVNGYIIMIAAEWLSSSLIGVLSWCYLWGIIESGFEFFFVLLCLWVVQTQCIIQIIINRIALLVRDQKNINRLKLGCALGLGLINISVFCIWIPARLQISPTWIHINEIWDRIEKVIFCLIDAGLNLYFIYLVRSKLIANGLTKYHRLFRFNLFMIACSVALDVILIGVMSLGAGFVYVQFHPLVYILKLHIELNMADLIAKIVKMENGGSYPSGSNPAAGYGGGKSGGGAGGGRTGGTGGGGGGGTNTADPRGFHMATLITANRDYARDAEDEQQHQHQHPDAKGIQKTVETVIQRQGAVDDDAASRSSSTAELQKQYNIV